MLKDYCFFWKHEEVAVASQSNKDCATRINKQMDPCYGNVSYFVRILYKKN